MEIDSREFVHSLAGYYQSDDCFNKALEAASVRHESSGKNYMDLLVEEYKKLEGKTPLAVIFSSGELKESITPQSSDPEVIAVLKSELERAIFNTSDIFRARVDRFGVSSPNIQLLELGRILVELPGIKDPERVRNLLQKTGNLIFWETYDVNEIVNYVQGVNDYLRSVETDEIQPAGTYGPVIGYAHAKDISQLNDYLNSSQVRRLLPRDLLFKWSDKPVSEESPLFELYAIKATNRDRTPVLDGDVILDAIRDLMQGQGEIFHGVTMVMSREGSMRWEHITENNIGRAIAIVVDDEVVSAPIMLEKISGGRVQITGRFTEEEAKDLAILLKSGKMPVSIHIVQEEIVSPLSIE